MRSPSGRRHTIVFIPILKDLKMLFNETNILESFLDQEQCGKLHMLPVYFESKVNHDWCFTQSVLNFSFSE